MTTLYRRATPTQKALLRIVEGAVRNALDAHPEVRIPDYFARSVAKRAAGTLSARLAGVLAATPAPSDGAAADIMQSASNGRLSAFKARPRRIGRCPVLHAAAGEGEV